MTVQALERRSWQTGEGQVGVAGATLLGTGAFSEERIPWVAAVLIAAILGRNAFKAAQALGQALAPALAARVSRQATEPEEPPAEEPAG